MRKLAVVTGGSRGIGRAIVEKFNEQGFDVVACARNTKDLEALEASLGVHTFSSDLSEVAGVEAFGDYVMALQRPVSVLVNNAGLFLPGSLIEEDARHLDLHFNTNVRSAYLVTRRIMPRLQEAANAHIFSICSIASRTVPPGSASYSISKFALLAWTTALRAELKDRGIKVTAVMPGATWTDSWAGTDLPESRFINAKEIADMVWAASQLNSVVEELVIRPQLGDI